MDKVYSLTYDTHDGRYYSPIGKTSSSLEKGFYLVRKNDSGIYFERTELFSDDLIEFKDSLSDEIIKECNIFWNRKKLFKQYGFVHRRGYMFYGPAGGGKTCLVSTIAKNLIKDNGVVFICDNSPFRYIEGISIIREIEPERKLCCIFEDIDSIVDKYGG